MAFSGGCGSLYSFKGFGSSFEWTDKSNYNFGLRYFRSPQKLMKFSKQIFYLGIAPTVFSINKQSGLNIAPELGLHVPWLYGAFGASVNLFYGYDIPFVNEKYYTINRHRITLKISFDINRDLFKKEKVESNQK